MGAPDDWLGFSILVREGRDAAGVSLDTVDSSPIGGIFEMSISGLEPIGNADSERVDMIFRAPDGIDQGVLSAAQEPPFVVRLAYNEEVKNLKIELGSTEEVASYPCCLNDFWVGIFCRL